MMTDIYLYFMKVVCYTGIKISLIYFTSYQNFISYFGHIKISNSSKMHVFAHYGPLNKIGVFFLLEHHILIIFKVSCFKYNALLDLYVLYFVLSLYKLFH